jgi:hypothetical protein
MTPIDFGVKGSKVQVILTLNAKTFSDQILDNPYAIGLKTA